MDSEPVRKSSEDEVAHTMWIVGIGEDKYFSVDHLPTCGIERVENDLGPDGRPFERHTCRLAWVLETWGFDFLGHADGREGWEFLEPGSYAVKSYTEYRPGEFGGTYGEEWDTGAFVEGEISTRIVMRPVWRRRQLRLYTDTPFGTLAKPTDAEKEDAIRVLEDPTSETIAPALWLEAFRIFEEASR